MKIDHTAWPPLAQTDPYGQEVWLDKDFVQRECAIKPRIRGRVLDELRLQPPRSSAACIPLFPCATVSKISSAACAASAQIAKGHKDIVLFVP